MAGLVLTPFVQDVIATAVAFLAFSVLAWRTTRIFRSANESPACDGCSNACTPAPNATRDAEAVIPLAVVRRRQRETTP